MAILDAEFNAWIDGESDVDAARATHEAIHRRRAVRGPDALDSKPRQCRPITSPRANERDNAIKEAQQR